MAQAYSQYLQERVIDGVLRGGISRRVAGKLE